MLYRERYDFADWVFGAVRPDLCKGVAGRHEDVGLYYQQAIAVERKADG